MRGAALLGVFLQASPNEVDNLRTVLPLQPRRWFLTRKNHRLHGMVPGSGALACDHLDRGDAQRPVSTTHPRHTYYEYCTCNPSSPPPQTNSATAWLHPARLCAGPHMMGGTSTWHVARTDHMSDSGVLLCCMTTSGAM
eukprot:m.112670 g.112670  ORF g.112670 m.112670 type:complete len:139 (-) comp17033_c1_seq3:953-1369(-)